ncbi:Cytochrome c6 [compost metagenome]
MELVKANCLGCHASDLKGQKSLKVPALRGVGDILTKEELVETVTNGRAGGAMPSFKEELSAEQIDQIATWLSKQKKAQ